MGHEFHRWQLNKIDHTEFNNSFFHKGISMNLYSPWEVKGWKIKKHQEGWSNKKFHASWMHLHWPSSPKILNKWAKSIDPNI